MIKGSSTGKDNDGKKKTSSAHGKNNTGHKGEANSSKFAEKSASRGQKLPIKSSSVSVTTKAEQHKIHRELASLRPVASKADFNELTSQIRVLDGVFLFPDTPRFSRLIITNCFDETKLCFKRNKVSPHDRKTHKSDLCERLTKK